MHARLRAHIHVQSCTCPPDGFCIASDTIVYAKVSGADSLHGGHNCIWHRRIKSIHYYYYWGLRSFNKPWDLAHKALYTRSNVNRWAFIMLTKVSFVFYIGTRLSSHCMTHSTPMQYTPTIYRQQTSYVQILYEIMRATPFGHFPL